MNCFRCGRENGYPICTACEVQGWSLDKRKMVYNFRTGEYAEHVIVDNRNKKLL